MPASICDGDPGKTALDGLKAVAATAQTAMNSEPQPDPIRIGHPGNQQDYALGWRGRGIKAPPYWPPYSDAVAFLAASEPSAAIQRVQATAMMERYFTLDVSGLPTGDMDAQNTRVNLARHRVELRELEQNLLRRRAFVHTRAAAIATDLKRIAAYLGGLDPTMAEIPCIVRCEGECRALIDALAPITDRISYGQAAETLKTLDTVLTALESITSGHAIVTNNQSIPTFFLLRLLVGYRIEPAESATHAYASIASAQLTALLHNKQAWLSDIMPRMIADLAQALDVSFNTGPTKVAFFLKGGRGLNYLLGTPEKGKNDWDTQILIDPYLPWTQWWELYNAVRAIVNNRLLRYNFVFSANLMANAPTLIADADKACQDFLQDPKSGDGIFDAMMALAVQASLDDQAFANDQEMTRQRAWQEANREPSGNCKAELIDVGVPRYATIELLEQWDHVRTDVIRTNVTATQRIPFPAAAYFIDELIGMMREFYAGLSPSPAKKPQRLERLLEVLGSKVPSLEPYLDKQTALMKQAGLSACAGKVAQIGSPQIGSLAKILLGQFCTAYGLPNNPRLAGAFDAFATDTDTGLDPDAINGAETGEKAADILFAWCHVLSEAMTKHLETWSKTLLDHRADISGILASSFDSRNSLPVVEGSFAVRLQQRGMAPAADAYHVVPSAFAPISIYLKDCPNIRDLAEDRFSDFARKISDCVQGTPFLDNGSTPDYANRTIQVYAQDQITLGNASYNPIVITFTFRDTPARLDVDNTGSLCLPGLEPLTRWCRTHAAGVTEWSMRRQLAETYGALIAMTGHRLSRMALPRSKL